jgi:hypothetical protein
MQVEMLIVLYIRGRKGLMFTLVRGKMICSTLRHGELM